MPVEAVDTVIVGGGLSGIHAARLLAGSGESFVVLEARSRLGGRILGFEHRGLVSDLGPSWYWPEIHPKTAGLIRELGLQGYRQYEGGMGRYQHLTGEVRTVGGFGMEPASWRLTGGMTALVGGLCEGVPADRLRLNHPVCRLEKTAGGVRVHVGEVDRAPWTCFHARTVILALPPRLAAATVLFEPDLPHPLAQAMLSVGTWMAGQAKFCALYDRPFWREAGLSGQAFSERGPLCEIHDGSSNGHAPYGLTGFLGVPAVQRSDPQGLTEAALAQLALIYGEPASRPTAVFYQDWARERYTATPYDQPPMREHPRYQPPAGRTCIWEGAVRFAGTETADRHGGYLEGALETAERAVFRQA